MSNAKDVNLDTNEESISVADKEKKNRATMAKNNKKNGVVFENGRYRAKK